MRVKLLIEYDGTEYNGWQVQKQGKTIAGEITRVAGQIFPGAPLALYGAGRTDGGVHASGQVAHLDCPDSLAPETLRDRLNDFLPTDIHILKLEKADPRFHARHHATCRHYLYQISQRRDALNRRFVWWVKEPLNTAAMVAAARSFVGFHDFVSFSDEKVSVAAKADGFLMPWASPGEKRPATTAPGNASGTGIPEKSTWVNLTAFDVREVGDQIHFSISGSHFLRKMVRRLVGNVVEVGRGKLTPEALTLALNTASKAPAEYTAPPQGLFLTGIDYE